MICADTCIYYVKCYNDEYLSGMQSHPVASSLSSKKLCAVKIFDYIIIHMYIYWTDLGRHSKFTFPALLSLYSYSSGSLTL